MLLVKAVLSVMRKNLLAAMALLTALLVTACAPTPLKMSEHHINPDLDVAVGDDPSRFYNTHR